MPPESRNNTGPRSSPTARAASACGLLVTLLAALVAGCGASRNRSTDVVTLDFWNGFTGPDGTTMERIVRRFNRTHPRIRVKMQIIPWGTYYDKVTLGLAFGGAPDVLILHSNRFPEFANYKSLEPLDDLVKRPGFPESDFAPAPWAAGVWKGRRCAIPLDCHPIGLYYNTRLFRQAGIVDADGNAKPPETLHEFLEAAKKLTVDENKDGRPEQWGFAYTWLRTNAFTFLHQFGADILTPDYRRSGLDAPDAARALGLMQALCYQHRVCPRPEGADAWMGFQTGKVAMALEGVYMLASLEEQKELEFAGAPCPLFGKRRAVWASTHLLAMPAGPDRAKREAAWTFMRYLSDESLDWARGGQVPVRKSILASSGFRKLQVQYAFSRELPYIAYEPPTVSYNQVVPFYDAAIEASLNRIKPTDEALKEAARRINEVLERE